MANSYIHTVVQPCIPIEDFTDLEYLVLSRVFDVETYDRNESREVYLSSYDGPARYASSERSQLGEALAHSERFESCLNAFVKHAMETTDDEEIYIDFDGDVNWQSILLDIVRRSKTLKYITVVEAFTCDKMRPDEFGGAAMMITASSIRSLSTYDLIREWTKDVDQSH